MTQRNTRQRSAIRAALDRAGRPLGALELLEATKNEIEGIGIATIYRNLKILVEEGWLVAVDLPGEVPRYEVAGKGHHHHFHCRSCDGVFEIEACSIDLRQLTPPGFQTTGHEVVLYGMCSVCWETAKRS